MNYRGQVILELELITSVSRDSRKGELIKNLSAGLGQRAFNRVTRSNGANT